MTEPAHRQLWQRVRGALAARGALLSGHPTESAIADHAKSRLGTDLVQRFVQQYYARHKYGHGEEALSHDVAQRLVQQLEAMPFTAAPAPVEVQPSPAAAAPGRATTATPPSPVDAGASPNMQEAVAYGDEDEHAERRKRVAAARRRLAEEGRAREIVGERARRADAEARRQEEEYRIAEAAAPAKVELRPRVDEPRGVDLGPANRAEREAAGDRKAAAARKQRPAAAQPVEPAVDTASPEDMDIIDLFLRADDFLDDRDFDRAIADFDVLIRRSPLDFHFQYRGRAHLGKRDYDRAIADFDEAIRRTPHYSLFYLDRAEAYVGKGALPQALRDCDKAVALKPDWSELDARGKMHHRMGDHDRALADYSEALTHISDQNQPGVAITVFNRGAVLHAKREYRAAIDDYDRSMKAWRGRKGWEQYVAIAYNARGCARHELHDYVGAIADFGESIRSIPDYRDPWFNRGRAFCDRADYDRALKDYAEAIRLDEADAQVHYGCAIALKRKGDTAGADRQLAIARKLDPQVERRELMPRRRSMLG